MTPKEKAKDLLNKIYKLDNRAWYDVAKQCAYVTVHELIEALHEHHWQNRLIIDYWQEVKNELEKL